MHTDRRAKLRVAREAHREKLERAAGAPDKRMESPDDNRPTPDAKPVSGGWKTSLLEALRACRDEPFFSRVMCVEKARWKYCPGHWGTVEECPGKNPGP